MWIWVRVMGMQGHEGSGVTEKQKVCWLHECKTLNQNIVGVRIKQVVWDFTIMSKIHVGG